MKLDGLGEFRIIHEILLDEAAKFGHESLGDDCGYFELGGSLLAFSADAGPTPLIQTIPQYQNDFESAGWHAAVATASDIATSCARPLLMMDTIDAPGAMEEAELRAYMAGYFGACAEFGYQAGGGDIRRSKSAMTTHTFGVGVVEHGYRIGRAGARPGDYLVVVGRCGVFISSYLRLRRNLDSDSRPADLANVRFPAPPVSEMRQLGRHVRITAASDSSDGVLGAVANIAHASRCGFELQLLDPLLEPAVRAEASFHGLDPWNLFFCWGDWSSVAVVAQQDFERFVGSAAAASIEWRLLGRARAELEITAHTTGCPEGRRINLLRNENFMMSGFSSGIEQHLDYMLRTKLFDD